MFIKQDAVIITNYSDIASEVVKQIVAAGGTKHGSGSTLTVQTRDGDYLSLRQSTMIEIKFGDTLDSQGNLVPIQERGESEIWSIHHRDARFQLDTWRNDEANAQFFVMRLTSSASDDIPYYFIMGRYKNSASLPVSYPFVISGSADKTPASNSMIFPYLNMRTSTRYRLFLPAGVLPNQGNGVCSSKPQHDENGLLGPVATALNYRCSDSAGGGLPIVPVTQYVQLPNKSLFYIGSINFLFYATTGFSDGKVIKKAGRSFQVCRAGKASEDNKWVVFLIEIPTGS